MISEHSIGIFLAVAEYGSLSAAARQLHFSQPTASEYLRQLEGCVGVRLIRREKGSRTAVLTEEGKAFLPIARRWMQQHQLLEREIENFARSCRKNSLCIAASSNGHQYLVSHIVCRLMRRHPDIELQLRGVERREIPSAIEKNSFDVAFVFGEPIYHEDVITVQLFEEEQYILCPASTPLPDGTVTPDMLDRAFEVCYSKHGSTDGWHKTHFGENSRPYFTVSNLMSAYQYLTDRRCWCIAPAGLAVMLAGDSSNKLTYRRISPAPAPRICSLLISKSCGREHIQRSLLECFREYAADIPYIKVLEG
ncbi:MAG: LysR family transcriptional regulator [Clostridia bacterium]|nr:LysR family transcriptional regulator [Clostridia bacterium]